LYREKNKYATAKGKFKKNLINVSGDGDDISSIKGRGRRTGFGSKDRRQLVKDISISHISDT
jgi:hypothetical protein